MLGLAAVLILHCRPTGSNRFHPSRRPLAAILPLFLRRVQLPIPLGLNLLLTPGEHVLWSDVADGTVQANVVVMLHITLYQAPCIFQRQRRSRPNAFAFQRLVPALNLAVRLWIIRGGSGVRHARDANELLEVASDELRAIVGDDSRLRFRVLLLGSLKDQFDIRFSHGLTQIPMHEKTTEPIQNAAQVIEGAAQVDVRNVYMPVLMPLQRLLETGSLARRLALPPG